MVFIRCLGHWPCGLPASYLAGDGEERFAGERLSGTLAMKYCRRGSRGRGEVDGRQRWGCGPAEGWAWMVIVWRCRGGGENPRAGAVGASGRYRDLVEAVVVRSLAVRERRA